MTPDRLEDISSAVEAIATAVEALRRGRAPESGSPETRADADIAPLRVATLLALGAGRPLRPAPAFVVRLEDELVAREAEGAAGRGRRWRSSLSHWRPRPVARAGVALALPVLMAVTLLLVRGPRQALADVRRLLSYVPGLGFVATRDVRVLAGSAAITREGVTVRVEQVIAGARGTRIVVSVETSGIAQDGETLTRVPDAGIMLRSATGHELAPIAWSQSAEGVVLTFGPLPPGTDSAVLSMRVPPGLPADTVQEQEGWTVHLSLGPEGEAMGGTGLAAPYDPDLSGQEHHGITLRVLDVAHTAQETVVRVDIEGYPALGMRMPPRLGGRLLPTLRDDAGRSYAPRRAPSVGFEAAAVAVPPGGSPELAGGPTHWQETLAFEPLHPEARELMLTVDGMDVDISAVGVIQVDLGDAPRIGDAFPVDVELEIAGATVRLTGATLVREELDLRDGVLVQTLLQFDARQVTPTDEVVVRSLTLTGYPTVVSGSPSHGGPEGIYAVGITFRDGHIPPGVLTLSVDRAGIIYRGPWKLAWSVPPVAKPLSLRAPPPAVVPAVPCPRASFSRGGRSLCRVTRPSPLPAPGRDRAPRATSAVLLRYIALR